MRAKANGDPLHDALGRAVAISLPGPPPFYQLTPGRNGWNRKERDRPAKRPRHIHILPSSV